MNQTQSGAAAGFIFTTSDAPTAEQLRAVDAGLTQYNQSMAPLAEVRQLAVFATDESGKVVGGAVGRTWGQCGELLELWVATEQRSRGVGKRLLQEFEAQAAARGCNVVYLTTLSFQAPEFYRKQGYSVLAKIGGHANGIIKFLMLKRCC